jgi:ABC-type glycerol-3-phosphate transport system substrate-binding protein
MVTVHKWLMTAGVLALVAGCGSSSPSATSGQAVNITYWTSSSTPGEINWLDSHFNATHKGITVSGQYIASSDDLTTKAVAALKTSTEPKLMMISQGLTIFSGTISKVTFNLLMAGSLIAVIPVLMVAMIAQRRIVEGLALGAAR